MALATTSNTVGNREDLADLIAVVEPEKYPLSSMLAKGPKPGATYVEWQVDNLDDPRFGGIVEGSDVSSFTNKAADRGRIGNYVEQIRRDWMVSKLQELVITAGVPSEAARSKAKCLSEVKRDIESVIGSDQDRAAGPTHRLRGLGDWIDSAGPSDVPAAYRTPAASIDATAIASLTEAAFNAVLRSVAEQGGAEQLDLPCGTALKDRIAGFTRDEGTTTAKAYQVHEMATSRTITFDVTIYKGPFNTINIIPDLYLGRTSGAALADAGRARGYVIDRSLVDICFLQRPGQQELEDQGGGRRGYIDTILTMRAKNPLGLGKFNATSLS